MKTREVDRGNDEMKLPSYSQRKESTGRSTLNAGELIEPRKEKREKDLFKNQGREEQKEETSEKGKEIEKRRLRSKKWKKKNT